MKFTGNATYQITRTAGDESSQGYGLYNNLKELEGVIQILEARSRLECDVYDSLKLIKYKIDNSAFNLDLLKEKINFIIEVRL